MSGAAAAVTTIGTVAVLLNLAAAVGPSALPEWRTATSRTLMATYPIAATMLGGGEAPDFDLIPIAANLPAQQAQLLQWQNQQILKRLAKCEDDYGKATGQLLTLMTPATVRLITLHADYPAIFNGGKTDLSALLDHMETLHRNQIPLAREVQERIEDLDAMTQVGCVTKDSVVPSTSDYLALRRMKEAHLEELGHAPVVPLRSQVARFYHTLLHNPALQTAYTDWLNLDEAEQGEDLEDFCLFIEERMSNSKLARGATTGKRARGSDEPMQAFAANGEERVCSFCAKGKSVLSDIRFTEAKLKSHTVDECHAYKKFLSYANKSTLAAAFGQSPAAKPKGGKAQTQALAAETQGVDLDALAAALTAHMNKGEPKQEPAAAGGGAAEAKGRHG